MGPEGGVGAFGIVSAWFAETGGGGGFEARPQLSAKKVPVFFLVPFDAETFKTCKYTQKKIYLGVPPHPPCQPGLSTCQRLLSKGGKNFTFKSDKFFSVSGDSKPKKFFEKKNWYLH